MIFLKDDSFLYRVKNDTISVYGDYRGREREREAKRDKNKRKRFV